MGNSFHYLRLELALAAGEDVVLVDVGVELVPLQRGVRAEVAGVHRVAVRAAVAVVGVRPDAPVQDACETFDLIG